MVTLILITAIGLMTDMAYYEIIEALFTTILPRGVSQLVKGPTRHSLHQSSSGLDHFYTNTPRKIPSVEAKMWGGSDHMLLAVTRVTKTVISNPTYVRRRSYQNFHPQNFITAIQ